MPSMPGSAHCRRARRATSSRWRRAGAPIDVSLAQLKSGALALKRDTGLNLLPLVARIARLQAGLSDRFAL